MAKEVCDRISQGWFTVIASTVIIKSGFLNKNHNKNIKNKPRKRNSNSIRTKGSDVDGVIIPFTSYEVIPEGTNSGALAESFDDLTTESTSLHVLEADVLLAFALCWGLLKSERVR